MDEMSVGRRIASLRAERELTQTELGDAIGVSDKTVSKWENGGCFPDITVIPILADFFSVTTDYLLRGTPRKVQYLAADCLHNKWREAVNEKYLKQGWRVEDIELTGDGEGGAFMAIVLEKEVYD